MKTRGSLPALYSSGDRVIGRLNLIIISYMIENTKIAESSISEQIFLDHQGSSRSLARHANLCHAPLGVVSWAGPPLVARPMCSPVGIQGYTPTGREEDEGGMK
jgi:hypothetical protein